MLKRIRDTWNRIIRYFGALGHAPMGVETI